MNRFFRRTLSLLLCLLLTLSLSLPALAQAEKASVSLRVTAPGETGDGFVLRTQAKGLSDNAEITYDYLVRKPGAEKFTYLKKGSASAALRYRPTAEGAYVFRVRMHENGETAFVSSAAVTAVLGDASAQETASAAGTAKRWNPAKDYPALPETVSSLDEFLHCVNQAILTFQTFPTVRATQPDVLWNDLMQSDFSFYHTAYLEGNFLQFFHSPVSGLSVAFSYDAAGQLIRNFLYGEPIADAETSAFEKKISALSKTLALSKKNDLEKAEAIHDHLIAAYCYDTQSSKDGSDYAKESFTATGLMENGYSVCEGYAELFGVLAILSGMQCYPIVGTMGGGPHMWNLIRIDGQWYHIDCTADDPLPDVPGRTLRTFFLLGDDDMRDAEYVWDSSLYPAAPASFAP